MIAKIVKFVVKTALALVVVAVVIAGAIGFALAKWVRTPAAAAAPAVSAPVPWGIVITAGNPILPTAMPAIPTPAVSAPLIPTPAVAQVGQQYLLTGILDPCCRPNDNWPVALEIRQGLLYATEFRGENIYEEYLAGAGIGPGVTSIISASAGWRHQNGYWHPILTVFYEDGTGAKTMEFDTRHMFGR